eukprot:sb/3468923/
MMKGQHEKQPMLEEGDDIDLAKEISYARWAVFCTLNLISGIIQTLPLALIVPISISRGLTNTESTVVLVSWPVSSLVTLILQPWLFFLSTDQYLAVFGSFGFVGFALFYFELTGHWFMVAAIIGRLLSGTSLFLVNNQLVSGVTAIVKGNVARASASWEVFNSAGQAVGAYIGVTLVGRLGFGHMMLCGATVYLLMVLVTHMAWPGEEDMAEEQGEEERGSTFRALKLRGNVFFASFYPRNYPM